MAQQRRRSSKQGAPSMEALPPVEGPAGAPARKSSKGRWSAEEDEMLRRAVQLHDGKHWKKVATYLQGRTDVQCLHRWQKVLNPNLVKGGWTPEEDAMLVQLVQELGLGKWSQIATHLQGRIGKQCRERWHNHLDPNINRNEWTRAEDEQLVLLHAEIGNKWAVLTRNLPGRTENGIKNHWNATLRKRVLAREFDYLKEAGRRAAAYSRVAAGQQDSQPAAAAQPSFQPQQQPQPRTRKAKAQGLPYRASQEEGAAAGSADVSPAAAAGGGSDGAWQCLSDSEGGWESERPSRKRGRTSKAGRSRKRQHSQQEQQQQFYDPAAAAAAGTGDCYAGYAADGSDYYASAAGAAGYGDYAAAAYGMAAYGPVIAAAAAAAGDTAAAAAAGASSAAGMQGWHWSADALAAAAASGMITPQLATRSGPQGLFNTAVQTQSPYIPGSSSSGRDPRRRDVPGLAVSAQHARSAVAAVAADGGGGGFAGGDAAAAPGGNGAAAGDDEEGNRAMLFEPDAEALQAAEALASLDNSRGSTQAFNSPSNASSRRPRCASLAAVAAAGAFIRQPDYADIVPTSSPAVVAAACSTPAAAAAAAAGQACGQSQPAGRDRQAAAAQQKQQQQQQQGQPGGLEHTLQQLLSMSSGKQQQMPTTLGEAHTQGVAQGMMLAFASMLLPGLPAAAAAAATAAPIGGSDAACGTSSAASPGSGQQPHPAASQLLQQQGCSGTPGVLGPVESMLRQDAAAAAAAAMPAPADSWGAATATPLPALLLLQHGSECNLRSLLQERFGSSGALAEAAASGAGTPLSSCDGGAADGAGADTGTLLPKQLAAGTANPAGGSSSRRSRLAGAQPGLKQLLATPGGAAAAAGVPSSAAGRQAAGAGCGGAGEGEVPGGAQEVLENSFPAMTPGTWGGARGRRGSGTGEQELLAMQQRHHQQQQTTPSDMLLSTQLGGTAFAVLQQLQGLLDSQQRNRGSGSNSRISKQPQQEGSSSMRGAGAAVKQRPGQQTGSAGLDGQGTGAGAAAAGTQDDESPTSPNEGLLQQQGQQGLGCLLSTPYPLLYRTNACGAAEDNNQAHEQQAVPQQKQQHAKAPGAGQHAAAQQQQQPAGTDTATDADCGYKSAAAAIEDAARCAAATTRVARQRGQASISPSSSDPAWTPASSVAADQQHGV